ncbi:MAG TPA: hypothetical protein VK618_04145 [Flavitalea sp.]|nr:hypothetical protein [Flavitalea sp.]
MKAIQALSLCCFIIQGGLAQTPEPDLKKLELTNNPVYVLMNVQPSNISRPSTPRDFAAGIQSAFVNGKIQPNIGMEFNPFNWIKKKTVNKEGQQETTTNSFVYNDYFSKAILPPIKKNFSISLATSESDTVVFGSLQPGSALGYGMRVTLIPGTVHKPTYQDMEIYAENDMKITFLELLEAFIASEPEFKYDFIIRAFDKTISSLYKRQDIRREMIPELQRALTIYKGEFTNSFTAEKITVKIEADRVVFDDKKLKALARIDQRTVPFAREGFILELALAGVSVLERNEWKGMVHGKTGLWITPSYRLDLSDISDPTVIQSLDFLGVIRYLWNNKRVDIGNYFDCGAKLQFNRNDWNFSFEGVARHVSEQLADIQSKWTSSWLVNFSYSLNESITFRFTYGSNFDGNSRTYTQPGKMLAIGGVNFGFLK